MNGIHGFILLKNKIENSKEFKKFKWQKPHQPNTTGTEKGLPSY